MEQGFLQRATRLGMSDAQAQLHLEAFSDTLLSIDSIQTHFVTANTQYFLLNLLYTIDNAPINMMPHYPPPGLMRAYTASVIKFPNTEAKSAVNTPIIIQYDTCGPCFTNL